LTQSGSNISTKHPQCDVPHASHPLVMAVPDMFLHTPAACPFALPPQVPLVAPLASGLPRAA
jgi:hypothetical protein